MGVTARQMADGGSLTAGLGIPASGWRWALRKCSINLTGSQWAACARAHSGAVVGTQLRLWMCVVSEDAGTGVIVLHINTFPLRQTKQSVLRQVFAIFPFCNRLFKKHCHSAMEKKQCHLPTNEGQQTVHDLFRLKTVCSKGLAATVK